MDPAFELHRACQAGSLLEVQRLLQREGGEAASAALDGDERTPLHWAALSGKLDVVLLLLQLDAVKRRINNQDDEGWSALLTATAAGHVSVIDALIAAGADLSLTTVGGQCPLHYHRGRVPVLKALLPHFGRTLDVRDMAGATALHRAAGPGFSEAVAELLSAGASIDAKDRLGNTPLHLACEEGREDTAVRLVQAGASLEASNAAGKTPLDVCPSTGRLRAALIGAAKQA